MGADSVQIGDAATVGMIGQCDIIFPGDNIGIAELGCSGHASRCVLMSDQGF
jgi:hypothetical protein